jgi:hypothetical protein
MSYGSVIAGWRSGRVRFVVGLALAVSGLALLGLAVLGASSAGAGPVPPIHNPDFNPPSTPPVFVTEPPPATEPPRESLTTPTNTPTPTATPTRTVTPTPTAVAGVVAGVAALPRTGGGDGGAGPAWGLTVAGTALLAGSLAVFGLSRRVRA